MNTITAEITTLPSYSKDDCSIPSEVYVEGEGFWTSDVSEEGAIKKYLGQAIEKFGQDVKVQFIH